MAIPSDIEQDFFAQKRGDKVPLCYNDYVEISSGPDKGKKGNIVLLLETEPASQYMVTLEDGSGDVELTQDALKLLGA